MRALRRGVVAAVLVLGSGPAAYGTTQFVRHHLHDRDRGVLAPGYRADVNVIDMGRLVLRRPEMAFDLPGGAHRLLQRAEGYRHTFVRGEETYTDGQPTDALPGRLIRGAQPAPA